MTPSLDHDFEILNDADVQDYNDAGILPQSGHVLKQINDWLQPTAYEDDTSEYVRHLSSHTPGTGGWLLETEECRQWRESKQRNVLWIKAVPGTGKSVLAAHCRAHISAAEKVPVLHFFFRHIVSTNRTPFQLVRDWLAQLLPASPLLQQRIKTDFLDSHQPLEAVGLPALWQLFCNAANVMSRIYCFADALDEMSTGHEDFLHQLISLGETTRCKVFLTSRPTPRIVERLRAKQVLQLTLGSNNMTGDISLYVDHRIERDVSHYVGHAIRTSGIKPAVGEDYDAIEALVRDTLRRRSKGSFLYTKLMMDNFLEKMHESDTSLTLDVARRTVDALPTGLTDMYRDMLSDHSQKSGISKTFQFEILQWVTHSERPLRLLELATILDLRGDSTEHKSNTKALLRYACGPLLEIMPSDIVGPIHHSFTEYLTNPAERSCARKDFPVIFAQSAHCRLATQCLMYIDHVSGKSEAEAQTLEQLKMAHPFFDYALLSWDQHVAKCGTRTPSELIDTLDRCVTNNPRAQKLWLERVFFKASRGDLIYNYDKKALFEHKRSSALHIAAASNLVQYVMHLADMGHDINANDFQDNSPLHCAAQAGALDSLVALLTLGATNSTLNKAGDSPMHLAAINNHSDIIDALAKSGADVSMRNPSKDRLGRYSDFGRFEKDFGMKPLDCAINKDHLEAAEAILKHLTPSCLTSAFGTAIECRRAKMATMIAQHPSFLANQPAKFDRLPLHEAANLRYVDCMAALLANGAKAEATYLGGTALHAFASCYASTDCADRVRGVEMLLQAGCPIDALDSCSRTALCWLYADAVLAPLLMSHGADPQRVVRSGCYPLHTMYGRSLESMKIWISHGLDINSRDHTGCTPLLSLLEHARQKVQSNYNPLRGETFNVTQSLETLLKLGADPTLSLESGVTPLHLASSLDHDNSAGVIDALICAGADVNARDHRGITPLMNVEPCYLRKVLPSFLNAGANIHAVDWQGRNAVFGQGHRGSLTNLSIQQMSDANFNINARDSNGTTLLHLACAGVVGRGIILQDLLRMAACPFAVDCWGNTAVHYAAMARDTEQSQWIRQLVDLGVDPRQVNSQGQSPLHLAAGSARSSALQALLPFCRPDIDKADIQGFVPLQFAAAYSLTHVLQLLRAGADPAYRSSHGESALHFAAVARDTNIMSALLSHLGPPALDFINSEDRNHRSALHHAARSGVPANVKLLLEHGADPSFRGRRGPLPLKICSEFPQDQRLWSKFDRNTWPMPPRASDLVHQLPALLRKEWPSLARGFDISTRHRRRGQDISIRTCARHLINAANPLSDGSKLLTALKDEAIVARCEPLADELIALIEDPGAQALLAEIDEKLSLPKKAEYKFGMGRAPNPKLVLDKILGEATIKCRRNELRRKVEEFQGDDHPGLLWSLIEYDFDPLLHHLSIAEEESNPARWPLLTTLASHGRHEALEHLALRSGKLRASPRERCWDSRHEYLFDITHNFHTQIFSTALKEPLDGLLMDACRSQTRNMEVIKVIVEKIGCSDLEKTLAVTQICASNFYYWHIDAIKYLVGHGADVNASNASHDSLLFLSCVNEFDEDLRPDLVKCLLELGADPNKLNSDGRSCLNVTCEPPPKDQHRVRFDAAVADLLLDFGADPEHGEPRLIMTAIATRNISLIRRLVEAGCDPNLSPEGATNTDIHGTSDRLAKVLNCLSFASAMGPFASGDPRFGSNAIHESQREHDEIIQLLLDAGADPFAPITASVDPFAPTCDDEPSLHLILSQGWRSGPILDVPGLDLERRDRRGKTLLLRAASSNLANRDFSKLVQLGCDIEAVDLEGRNFFHCLAAHYGAAFWQFSALRDVLAPMYENPSFNRLINAPDFKGRSPMHHLRDPWGFATGMILGAYGAHFDVPDSEGNIPLHSILSYWADPVHRVNFKNLRPHLMYPECSSDQLTSMVQNQEDARLAEPNNEISLPEWLIDRGVNVNAPNKAGEPALFDVLRTCPTRRQHTYGGDEELPEQMFVKKLQSILNVGADVHIKSQDGSNALHILATRSPGRDGATSTQEPLEMPVKEAWKMLVAAGLDPWAEDNNQRSALDIAAASDNTTILGMY